MLTVKKFSQFLFCLYFFKKSLSFTGEVCEKRNVVFFGQELFSFNPVVTLYFEPSLSNGTESDPITFLNIPAVVCTPLNGCDFTVCCSLN